jgi:hypothetical protein
MVAPSRLKPQLRVFVTRAVHHGICLQRPRADGDLRLRCWPEGSQAVAAQLQLIASWPTQRNSNAGPRRRWLMVSSSRLSQLRDYTLRTWPTRCGCSQRWATQRTSWSRSLKAAAAAFDFTHRPWLQHGVALATLGHADGDFMAALPQGGHTTAAQLQHRTWPTRALATLGSHGRDPTTALPMRLPSAARLTPQALDKHRGRLLCWTTRTTPSWPR